MLFEVLYQQQLCTELTSLNISKWKWYFYC